MTMMVLLQALPFADGGWERKGDAAVETHDGREALRVDSGWAYRRDVKLEDGTIDFDVQLSRRRSFIYLCFRMQDDREYEEIYLRPHKSELPDAVQYAPVHQGQSAWQLHHGPGRTAAVRFEPGAWTPVRVVLSGRRMALFVGDLAKPAVVTTRLAREPRPGYLALRGFLPPGSPGRDVVARFANVRVTAGPPAFDFASAEAPPLAEEKGRVRAWSVAGPIPEPPADGVPDPPTAGLAFREVEADPTGLVELHRHVRVPAGTTQATAVARIRVTAERAGPRVFDLGWSDRATVFVNGRGIFRGEASYSFAGRREGLIGYDQARLYLPLSAGANEVVVVVSDSFGGMGIMGRFPDGGGLVVEAR
jgi:hypothetical protein